MSENNLSKRQFPLNIRIVKWQDSRIGKYIEFKIVVFYQEGPGSTKQIEFDRSSMDSNGAKTEVPSTIYSWIVFKRYSNFIDLHEALEPVFRTENIPQPTLPPKIELINDTQRNANLTDRKKQLQKYLREVVELLS